MSALLENSAYAAQRTAGGGVTHRESIPVAETFRGQIVWEGVVEVFGVDRAPDAVVYGWAVEGDEEPQFVAVLGTDLVNSPLSAVRAWIMSQTRK